MSNKESITLFASLLNFGYLCAIRGEEFMKVEILGILKYLDTGVNNPKFKDVVVALLGRIKGELGERYHMLIIPRVTSYGVMASRLANKLVLGLIQKGRRNGFVLVEKVGKYARIGSFNGEFYG